MGSVETRLKSAGSTSASDQPAGPPTSEEKKLHEEAIYAQYVDPGHLLPGSKALDGSSEENGKVVVVHGDGSVGVGAVERDVLARREFGDRDVKNSMLFGDVEGSGFVKMSSLLKNPGSGRRTEVVDCHGEKLEFFSGVEKIIYVDVGGKDKENGEVENLDVPVMVGKSEDMDEGEAEDDEEYEEEGFKSSSFEMTKNGEDPDGKVLILCTSMEDTSEEMEGIEEAGSIDEKGLEPAQLVTKLKHIARNVSVSYLLELRLLKSHISAFNQSRGCCGLPVYKEPVPIPGLEDDTNSGRTKRTLLDSEKLYRREKGKEKVIVELTDSPGSVDCSYLKRQRKGFSSRKKKKSKYLSPPYFTPPLTSSKKQKKCAITEALSEENLEISNLQKKVNLSANEVLSEISSIALNPRESEITKNTEGLITLFRSSCYQDGLNYSVYNGDQPGRKFRQCKKKRYKTAPANSYSEDDQAGYLSNEAKQLSFVRERLEKMSSLFEGEVSDGGGGGPEWKSKLEGEMNDLLKNVSSMVGVPPHV